MRLVVGFIVVFLGLGFRVGLCNIVSRVSELVAGCVVLDVAFCGLGDFGVFCCFIFRV